MSLDGSAQAHNNTDYFPKQHSLSHYSYQLLLKQVSSPTVLSATQTCRSVQSKKQGQMQMKSPVPVLQEVLPEGKHGQARALSAQVTLCSGRGVHQHRDLYRAGAGVINVMAGLLFTYLIIPICPSNQPFQVLFLFNLKETQNNKQRGNICTNNQKVIYRLKILVKSV